MRFHIFILSLLFLVACTNNNSTSGQMSSSNESDCYVIEEDTVIEDDNTDEESEEYDEDGFVEEEELSDEEKFFNSFDNFEPSGSDVKGVVVYEGSSSYYIIETNMGFTIAEWYGGAIPVVGQTIYGKLNSFCMNYFIILNNERETQLWIEDYWKSKDSAIEWLGEHNHLNYYDQSRYDEAKNSYNNNSLFDEPYQMEDF